MYLVYNPLLHSHLVDFFGVRFIFYIIHTQIVTQFLGDMSVLSLFYLVVVTVKETNVF